MKQLLFGTLALAGVPLVGLGQTLTNSGAVLTVDANAHLFVDGNVQNATTGTLTVAGVLRVIGDLSNTGTLALGAASTSSVNGHLQNQAGGTLTNAGDLYANQNFTNSGTFTCPGLLVFGNYHDQVFTPNGTISLSNLAILNSGVPGDNRVFIAGDLTVASSLSFYEGLLRTQAPVAGGPLYTLSLPNGGSLATSLGEVPGKYVQGRLAVTRTNVSATTDFQNGLKIDPNGQNLGTVTVTRTAGLQAPGLSYGQNLSGTTKGIDRVWQVVATQPLGAPATVTATWLPDDDNGLNLSTPVQLWRAGQAAGPWAAQGAPGGASSRSLTASVAQLGTFTASNTSAPLPVALVTFTAERLGADGLLQWATASELRNDHFEVESSLDGVTFRPLGRVAGAGTSAQAHRYQFIDNQLARYAAALVYYRLRQVDADGTGTYSPVRTVAAPPEAGLLVQAYPNPSAPGTAVALSLRTAQAGPATLRLTDMLGRELGQQQLDLPLGPTTLPLPGASQLAPGVYLLRVQQGQQQQALKLVRQD